MHRDLRLAGQLPPLDAPHHMRADEWRAFREGLVTAAAPGAGSLFDVGLDLVRPGSISRATPASACGSAAFAPMQWHSFRGADIPVMVQARELPPAKLSQDGLRCWARGRTRARRSMWARA